ncbi:hypothetical protein [Cellulosimicrobium sp. JZ28]|uniref:hypothetical protein n=1 Tax=Cellulosimicrobium sp. JZ28 TaxID=1906273 RepID=UPI00188B27F6|nr:hypothetical protein [Cellulosimicrobium sp. JZ28]
MCQHHDDTHPGHDDHPHDAAHHHAPATAAGVAPATGEAADDDLAECPVMRGSMVAKAHAEAAGLVRDHEGVRYWLCCSSCGPLFDADPARYARAA